MNFQTKLDRVVDTHNTLLCIGLDSDLLKIPSLFQSGKTPQFSFNKAIIDATHDLVCAYKPNSAFYEAYGSDGIAELKLTCDYLRSSYPEIPIILDAKRADIGNTNAGYVSFAFDYLGADAITLHPYLGREAIQPFLDRKDKGCIILCRTSNPGAGEFQDLTVDTGLPAEAPISGAKEGLPAEVPLKLYQHIAKKVKNEWNENGNCSLVVGATYPEELKVVRGIIGDMTILVPGIGTQGGDIKKTVDAGLNFHKSGMIINVSRAIIYNDSPRVKAKSLVKEINLCRTS